MVNLLFALGPSVCTDVFECVFILHLRVQKSPPPCPFLVYHFNALKRLIKGRVLIKGHFNESRFDRTNWYAFTELGQYLMTESEGDYNE